MKVVNLFGEPSVGKSTVAAGLFFLMKQAGLNVELVNEYAKECVWEDKMKTLDDQLYITAKQNHKLERLRGKVDYAITDSPLILGILYSRDSSRFPSFHKLVNEAFCSYHNINIVLRRAKSYNPVGRMQTENEASIARIKLLGIMDEYKVVGYHMDGDKDAPQKIFSLLTQNQT